jgi:hypothetical protein
VAMMQYLQAFPSAKQEVEMSAKWTAMEGEGRGI